MVSPRGSALLVIISVGTTIVPSATSAFGVYYVLNCFFQKDVEVLTHSTCDLMRK